jgi:hypothetical protein
MGKLKSYFAKHSVLQKSMSGLGWAANGVGIANLAIAIGMGIAAALMPEVAVAEIVTETTEAGRAEEVAVEAGEEGASAARASSIGRRSLSIASKEGGADAEAERTSSSMGSKEEKTAFQRKYESLAEKKVIGNYTLEDIQTGMFYTSDTLAVGSGISQTGIGISQKMNGQNGWSNIGAGILNAGLGMFDIKMMRDEGAASKLMETAEESGDKEMMKTAESMDTQVKKMMKIQGIAEIGISLTNMGVGVSSIIKKQYSTGTVNVGTSAIDIGATLQSWTVYGVEF